MSFCSKFAHVFGNINDGPINKAWSSSEANKLRRQIKHCQLPCMALCYRSFSLMEKIANGLYWFEESLVLKGSGDGLINVLQKVGAYLIRIDYLFSRPRYLWLIILLTLLVVF